MKILSADLGGTKVIFQHTEYLNSQLKIIAEKRYECKYFHQFSDIIQSFITQHQITKIDVACLAIAGPIHNETDEIQSVKLSNLPWTLNNKDIASEFNIAKVKFINDFQAIGYGIELLAEDDLIPLQSGKPAKQMSKAVIGAGTGLGHCTLIWNGSYYETLAAEAGHINFAPITDEQIQLLQYLRNKYQPVSFEHVVSGSGIVDIYQFYAQNHPINQWDIIQNAPDPAAKISELALSNQDSCALKTLNLFIECYGSQAGNFTLCTIPKSGLYIAGGIATKILKKMQTGNFMKAFLAKDKMTDLLKSIPVYIIKQPKVGLLGATHYAQLKLTQPQPR